MRWLGGFNHWLSTFEVDEPAYLGLILGVISTFEIDCAMIYLHLLGWICFQVHRECRSMCYSKFMVFLGVYKHDFVSSIEYSRLPLNILVSVTPYSLSRVVVVWTLKKHPSFRTRPIDTYMPLRVDRPCDEGTVWVSWRKSISLCFLVWSRDTRSTCLTS